MALPVLVLGYLSRKNWNKEEEVAMAMGKILIPLRYGPGQQHTGRMLLLCGSGWGLMKKTQWYEEMFSKLVLFLLGKRGLPRWLTSLPNFRWELKVLSLRYFKSLYTAAAWPSWWSRTWEVILAPTPFFCHALAHYKSDQTWFTLSKVSAEPDLGDLSKFPFLKGSASVCLHCILFPFWCP